MTAASPICTMISLAGSRARSAGPPATAALHPAMSQNLAQHMQHRVGRDREANALSQRIIAVLMPITSPAEETSGPPELPGLRAASVWITSPISRPF